MQTIKFKHIFSVFSGTFYDVPEDDVKILDDGQIPLNDKPKKCSKCYNRGYVGRDKNTLVYQICSCIRKNIDFSLIKDIATIDK